MEVMQIKSIKEMRRKRRRDGSDVEAPEFNKDSVGPKSRLFQQIIGNKLKQMRKIQASLHFAASCFRDFVLKLAIV